MCINIDGMDQNKLLIPSLLHQAKSYASAWRLKTHLTGILTSCLFNFFYFAVKHFTYLSTCLYRYEHTHQTLVSTRPPNCIPTYQNE